MAGAGSAEERWAWVSEVTAGTIPTSPSFNLTSLETVAITATPNVREQRQKYANRRRSGISRSGFPVEGTGNGQLVYGVYDDLLASLLQGSWQSNVLKDSTTGQSTFAWERTIPAGAGGASRYFRYKGVEVSGGSLTLTAEEDAAVEFQFMGTGSDDAASTALSGATYTDPTNTTILGSGSDIGFWTMGSWTVPCMRSGTINFTMEGKERQPRIGSDDACGVTRGAAMPVITAEAYVEEEVAEFYNAARAGTEFAVTIPLGKDTGEKYELYFPKCQFTTASIEVSDPNLYQNLTIMPIYDTATDCIVQITRGIA